ncbi:putative transcriptional regulatory protein [Colletotrichum viniferum]|nr:putative transcriptional regulatory protein [Colletotrichum viniferum]
MDSFKHAVFNENEGMVKDERHGSDILSSRYGRRWATDSGGRRPFDYLEEDDDDDDYILLSPSTYTVPETETNGLELSFLHVPTLKNRIYDLTTGHASVAFDTQLVLLGLLALTGRYHGELADYFDNGSEEVSYDPSLGDQGISEAFARTLDKSLGSFVSACSIGSVERVQALLMLGLYEWISPNHEGLRAWMLVGSAGRMAQALKLGYEANYSTANHSDATLEDAIVDREIRRRTMFSCFIFDRLISCGKERPSFIRSDDLHVRLPCAKEDFDLSRQTSTEWFSGDMDSSLHDETSILGRFVQLVDLWGRISQYSSAGGRFLDKQRPPWNPESLFFQLRREADAFSKTLDAPGAFLSLSPSNYFRHESTSSTFIILHLLMSLCKIMLHRQYLPFIPIKCTRPSGPLDEPTFPPEEVPPGFWEESARELFGASKTVANVIELCEDRLPHSPLVAFVIYTASFTGVYAQHFPRMDTEACLCSRSSERDEMAENQPISASFGPTKVMFDTLSGLARYSGVAAAFVARFYEVDQYFSSMVQDYHRNLRHRTTSQQSASSHLHYSAISIAIMQFFQIASILAVMASSVSAVVTVGSACEGAGYECVSGNAAIASCDGAKWQLAANCGGCSDACVKRDVGTPYCKC